MLFYTKYSKPDKFINEVFPENAKKKKNSKILKEQGIYSEKLRNDMNQPLLLQFLGKLTSQSELYAFYKSELHSCNFLGFFEKS